MSASDVGLELWECPPLHARLSRSQCASNRARACTPNDPRQHVAIGEAQEYALRLRECTTCKGVGWWAKETGRGPLVISREQILTNHLRDEARRRRMGGGRVGTELH
jgi:hypothetical protein